MALTESEAIVIGRWLDAPPAARVGETQLCFIFGTSTSDPIPIALKLHRAGFSGPIVVTGGMNRNARFCEATWLTAALVNLGISRGQLLVEERSQNTLENVLFSLPILNERVDLSCVNKILIVTKWYHYRRARLTMKRHLPMNIDIRGITYEPHFPRGCVTRTRWNHHDYTRELVLKELRAIPRYARQGDLWDEDQNLLQLDGSDRRRPSTGRASIDDGQYGSLGRVGGYSRCDGVFGLSTNKMPLQRQHCWWLA